MDLLKVRQELFSWRQLSFHIDRALDALQAPERPEADSRLYRLWRDSVEQERQRLQSMRTVSPELQYLALRGEKLLRLLKRKERALESPAWWQFWRRKNQKKAQIVAEKAQSIAKRVLKKGRHLLRKTSPANAPLGPRALSAVHRAPCFLFHPRLLSTMHRLASARSRLREQGDEESQEQMAELYLEFADLLRQCDQFSLEEKLGALDRIEGDIDSLLR